MGDEANQECFSPWGKMRGPSDKADLDGINTERKGGEMRYIGVRENRRVNGVCFQRSEVRLPSIQSGVMKWEYGAMKLVDGVMKWVQLPLSDPTGRWEWVQHAGRGLPNTYMVGEKYVRTDWYANGMDSGDNEHPYTGFNDDITRSSGFVPKQDRVGMENSYGFGSAHVNGFHMAFCDGSVRRIPYTVDPALHKESGKTYLEEKDSMDADSSR